MPKAQAPGPVGPDVIDPVEPISARDCPVYATGSVSEKDRGRFAKWLHDNDERLRRRAAELAVDMEQGAYDGDVPYEPGSHTKANVAAALGFDRYRQMHKGYRFMREPDWSRALTWERTKREVHYGMSLADTRPVLRTVVSALLIETCRRALEEPASFRNGELLDATRKYLELLGTSEGQSKPTDVRSTVNVFLQNVQLLPEAARTKALGLFENEIESLSHHARKALKAAS